MSKITNDDNPVWYRMLYSCTHVATVDVKGLRMCWLTDWWCVVNVQWMLVFLLVVEKLLQLLTWVSSV